MELQIAGDGDSWRLQEGAPKRICNRFPLVWQLGFLGSVVEYLKLDGLTNARRHSPFFLVCSHGSIRVGSGGIRPSSWLSMARAWSTSPKWHKQTTTCSSIFWIRSLSFCSWNAHAWGSITGALAHHQEYGSKDLAYIIPICHWWAINVGKIFHTWSIWKHSLTWT